MLPLSPIDHMFTGRNAYPISFLFEYAGRLDPDRLRQSLEATADDFPPVRSRLVPAGPSAWAFAPSDEPCAFTVDALDAAPDPDDPAAAVTPVETLPGEPLLRVRLTHTPESSLLGVSLSHAVVDGYSCFLFLTAWSRRLRGEAAIVPDLDRGKLIPIELPERSTPVTADEVLRRTGWVWAGPRQGSEPGRVRRSFPLSKAALDEILRENGLALGLGLSFNDVIAAHLCRTYAPHARFLTCPYDFRRLHPELGPHYFGNAVASVRVPMDPDASLKGLCGRVRDGVRAVDLAYVRDSLLCLEELRRERGLAVTEELAVVDPADGFLVTNLSRMPVKELDFGTGLPQRLQFLTPIPGTAVILPAADGFQVQLA